MCSEHLQHAARHSPGMHASGSQRVPRIDSLKVSAMQIHQKTNVYRPRRRDNNEYGSFVASYAIRSEWSNFTGSHLYTVFRLDELELKSRMLVRCSLKVQWKVHIAKLPAFELNTRALSLIHATIRVNVLSTKLLLRRVTLTFTGFPCLLRLMTFFLSIR